MSALLLLSLNFPLNCKNVLNFNELSALNMKLKAETNKP